MHTISISEKKWAVGLWWQPLVSSPRRQVGDLNNQSHEAEESPYNVFVTLKGRKQVGIGRAKDVRGEAGRSSLAGTLARVFGVQTNTLALFRFDDGNGWLFALKDGSVLPGGDIYGPESDILDQFRRYSQSDVWRQVIETAGTEETEQKLGECLAALSKKKPRVRPVSRTFWLHIALTQFRKNPRTAIVVGLAVVGVAALIIGVSQYMAYQSRMEEERLLRQRQAMLQEELDQQGKSFSEMEKELFPEHWRHEPDPLQVIRHCYARLQGEPYHVRGWKLVEIACNSKESRVTRERSSWASFTNLPDQSQFQITDPNLAVRVDSYNLGSRKKRDLIGKEIVSANIYELATILDSPVELAWEQPEPRDVPEAERKMNSELPMVMLSPYWTGEFHLPHVPESFIRGAFGLDRIPGLAISEVKKEDESWSIKGEMYAR